MEACIVLHNTIIEGEKDKDLENILDTTVKVTAALMSELYKTPRNYYPH
jgi:hypothetical protein